MSAWAELVNSNGSDEHLELCNAALKEIRAQARAAALREAAGHRQRYENQMVAAAELIGELRKAEATIARVRTTLLRSGESDLIAAVWAALGETKED